MNLKTPTNLFRSHLFWFFICTLFVTFFAFVHTNSSPITYVIRFFSFIYILLVPGLLILPFLSTRRFPFALGVSLAVALSTFFLMFGGLILNTILPLFKVEAPLTTLSCVILFDLFVFVLIILNHLFSSSPAILRPHLNRSGGFIVCVSILLPIMACVGAIILNNGGSSLMIMSLLILVGILVSIIIFTKNDTNNSAAPIVLFMTALAFLLMNSMRGWFITGHDILLEYHVFTLTNDAHRWSMAFYQDPYNACLSLTILPTYIQNLLHVGTEYIFKFFMELIGALSVIVVYYLTKKYVSEKTAFLIGFLYISFPTFMVDMAFLNRQGVAFLFLSSMIFTLVNTEYFPGRTKTLTLFVFGTGMIFSHYSTSYIAVPVLLGAYFINRLLRLLVNAKRPKWLFYLTSKLANKEMYQKPILLTFPFVVGLLIIMILWSSVITKTSKTFMDTIQQIVISLKTPFSFDEQTGPAKYSLVKGEQPSPEELLNRFVEYGVERQKVAKNPSEFFPQELIEKYKAVPVPEFVAPLTSLGKKIESIFHLNLDTFYKGTKQAYARVLQILLVVGLIGLMFGYSFKKNILQNVPIEYIAISVSGILVMVAQTILPAVAINYGLLRLFQQNLLFLSLPIFLGFLAVISVITNDHKKQIIISTGILLLFFSSLSGLIPQITGGTRPLLFLNNNGLYYDSYYTHAQEVASANWLAQFGHLRLPIQAAHFSDIKMIAYGRIGAYIELLPETTKKRSFVYLNYDNVKSSNILEIIYGDVVYYHFPLEFLRDNKNLIYSNGGSEIYR